MTADPIVEMQAISADGTSIALERSGSGSPVILVHGTGADHTRWAGVRLRLAERLTVYALDRRGHGKSGDAPSYALAREAEDIMAAAAAVEGPVDILGHSFGAACVLGAAARIPNLRRLILYEPPMLHEQHTPQRAELIDRMEAALAAGDRETIMLILMNTMLKIPLATIERARATPAWAGQLASAHTIPRELRCADQYGANPEALKAITAPTLFLLGSESLNSFRSTTETLHGLLPGSRIVTLPGQQHSAMLTAPDLFVREVLRFLEE